MIPKVIHWCWFSGDPYPRKIQHCLDSWQKHLKDYTIKCWDAESFDFDSMPFVKDAFERRKWAFVADYIRFYAIYTEGGIYLDSDVELFDNLDRYLDCRFFTGTDKRSDIEWYGVEGAIMGCEKGHPLPLEIMHHYEAKDCFMLPDGKMNCQIIPDMMVPFMERRGYDRYDETQHLEDGVVVYSTDHFRNSMSSLVRNGKKPTAYHHNTATWIPYMDNRGKIYNFFRNHDLLHIYEPLERMVLKAKKCVKR